MNEYWQLHVRLLDVSRPLWRRFLLAKSATFGELHSAIQDACGWADCHLYMFQDRKTEMVIAGIPDPDGEFDIPDAASTLLSSYFASPSAKPLLYVYDFGDFWEHEVKLEGVKESRISYFRRLTGGRGTFPPEDCGSTEGYERCLALATGEGWLPEFGDEREMQYVREWMGDWDPESFDLSTAKEGFDV